jgi:hypothetical protein
VLKQPLLWFVSIIQLAFNSSDISLNEMVQGPCAHLQLHEFSTAVLDRINVIIDRLNVISSGSVVHMKIDAKACFQGDGNI